MGQNVRSAFNSAPSSAGYPQGFGTIQGLGQAQIIRQDNPSQGLPSSGQLPPYSGSYSAPSPGPYFAQSPGSYPGPYSAPFPGPYSAPFPGPHFAQSPGPYPGPYPAPYRPYSAPFHGPYSGPYYGTINQVALSTTSKPPTGPSLPPLARFNIQALQWAEPLLSESEKALVLEINNTTHKLALRDDGIEPHDKEVDAQCETALSGGDAGLCVYLTRCSAAKDITSEIYKTTFCKVDEIYAGVCCPQKSVTNARVKSENKLPGDSSSDKPSVSPSQQETTAAGSPA